MEQFRGIRAYRFFDVEFLKVAEPSDRKHQICLFAKGEGAFSLGGNDEEIVNNSLFFITPNVSFKMECDPAQPLDFFIVQFEAPASGSAYSLGDSYFIKVPPSERDVLVGAAQDLVVACARQLDSCASFLLPILAALEKLIHTNSIIFATRHVGRFIKDIPRHIHFSEFQIDYFSRGQGRFLLGDSREHFAPGDLFFVPPKVPHEIIFSPTVEIDNFSLKININQENGLALPGEPFKISVDSSSQPTMLVIFKNIVGKFIMDRPVSLSQLSTLLNHIQLLRGDSGAARGPGEDKVEKTRQLIAANYFRPLRTRWLAEQVGLSPEYLSRLFKKATGENISEHLIRVRLNAAINMVRTTDIPLKRIASECGFPNVGYFGSSFKKRFGATPGSVRRSGEMPVDSQRRGTS
jgi:AraC-like DNA-binding protein/quercetin dioxygenase-like cupin family protein